MKQQLHLVSGFRAYTSTNKILFEASARQLNNDGSVTLLFLLSQPVWIFILITTLVAVVALYINQCGHSGFQQFLVR
ncbi:hypothetical protein E2C01_075590 [Portunus trituberculatus]|uniref:Uncharacterized protein n=1 Tax=Portunus trituberculatus TaxID=210409 RepID=A0A5B7I8Z3_PORTR|nr:hypothetical protein [Portunus trituberculatus]